MKMVEFSPEEVDLVAMAELLLPYPTGTPDDIVTQAAEKFELLLYKDYFVDSGRAHAKSERKIDPFHYGPLTDLSEETLFKFADDSSTLPTKVCERIKELNGGLLVYEPWYKNSLGAKKVKEKQERDARLEAGLADVLLNGPTPPRSR
jgi:hypothetical protein